MSVKDPKSLIYEAYQIADLDQSQCRSIFLDWALSLPEGVDAIMVIPQLLIRYAEAFPDHPMTVVLQEGLQAQGSPQRRGGWRSRSRPQRLN
ncbi:hypothetical protein [Epibacterium ulvae]|uniref:hypothetical protein n=1 Tax=Epibacterium ulvae TaxID=1156985 RepID=UPI0024917657|nr:hypothetical protein [Epibacterium ulvae]